MQIHPVADLFPMMSDDDLASLAEDIKANGQTEPIMLDAAGEVLIDGRNRLAACKLAGVEPKFTRLNGEDQTAFILSRNMARRNLTKGQLAIVAAKASPKAEQRGGDRKSPGAQSTFKMKIDFPMVSDRDLSQARVIVEHAPLLADGVLSGTKKFSEAFADAQKTKAERAEAAEKKAKLAGLVGGVPEFAETALVEVPGQGFGV